jgi:hypothetical protein
VRVGCPKSARSGHSVIYVIVGKVLPAPAQQEASLPEPDGNRDELRARLWRLPRQLLLALINGTAILVIVAAILALVALSKVTHLANDVASTMTDAVLSRIDVKPRQVLANLQNVAAEVYALRGSLKQARAEGAARLDPQVAKLSETLSALQASIEQLGEARSSLIDEAITRMGREMAERLQNFKECKPAQANADTFASPAMAESLRLPSM